MGYILSKNPESEKFKYSVSTPQQKTKKNLISNIQHQSYRSQKGKETKNRRNGPSKPGRPNSVYSLFY